MDDYKDLNTTIASETEKLHNIIAHSSMLPESIRNPINASLISYCNQVLEQEWKMKRTDDDNRANAIPGLRVMLLQLESQNRLGQNLHKVLDEDLSSISDLRRNRLSYNQSHVPDFVWFILKGGSIMLIVFYYFLHVASALRKRFYLVILSSYIAMCMFMVYSLDSPYIGKTSVYTGQYIEVLASLKHHHFLTTNEIEK